MNKSYTNIVETDADNESHTIKTSLNTRSHKGSKSGHAGMRLREVKAMELQKLGFKNREQNILEINKRFTFSAHRGQKSF